MIQPAALSFLSPAPARATPPPMVSGAVFALPGEGIEAALLVGTGDGERQADAAPGKPLPIAPAEPTPWPPLAPAPIATDQPATPLPGEQPSKLAEGEIAPAPSKPARARKTAAKADDPAGTDMPATTTAATAERAVADLAPTALPAPSPPAPTPAPSSAPRTSAADETSPLTTKGPVRSLDGETQPLTGRVATSAPPALRAPAGDGTPVVNNVTAPIQTVARPADDTALISGAPIDTLAPAPLSDTIVSTVREADMTAAAAPTRDEVAPIPPGAARTEPSTLPPHVAPATRQITRAPVAEPSPPPRTVLDGIRAVPNGTPLAARQPTLVGATDPSPAPLASTPAITAASLTVLPSHWQRALPIAPAAPVHDLDFVTPLPTVAAEMPVGPTPPDRPTASVAPVPLPASSPPPLVVQAAPAALVFGAARFAAQFADDRDERPLAPGLAPLAAPATIERPLAVPATPQASLDMTREHWPASMIERIEMIRDAANEVDSRIRLIPDALGTIDVAVKADGDTLHVRFQAEQPQTRALLAEAAPRLAEAAEARGLRLGQTSVGGDANPGGQPGQQQRPAPPSAPPRARSPAADASAAADDDTRLA